MIVARPERQEMTQFGTSFQRRASMRELVKLANKQVYESKRSCDYLLLLQKQQASQRRQQANHGNVAQRLLFPRQPTSVLMPPPHNYLLFRDNLLLILTKQQNKVLSPRKKSSALTFSVKRFKLAHTTPSKPHMVINILILKEEAGESTQKVDHVLKNFQQGFETLVVVVGITLKVFCLFAQQWQQQNSSPLYSSSYWLLIMQLEYWRPSCSASHHYETVLIVDGVWGRAESATLVLSCK